MFSDPQKNIEQFAVDPGLSVADFGSGAGFYALALSRAVGPTGNVYAIDVQQDLLIKLKNEAIRQNISNIEIVLGNVEENKGSQLKDNSVDRVVIVNMLFQTKDKDAVIDEAKRILKDKGTILIIDWSDSFGGLGPASHYLFNSSQAEALCKSHGLEVVRSINAGDHHYGFILKKL